MNNLLKSTLTALVVIVLLLAIVALLPGRAPAIETAQASGLNGLTGSSVYPPLLNGTTRYTTSLVTSPAVSIASFGEVQIMLSNVVTGSQTVTVTPQFSLQNLACANVTQWFTATSLSTYQPSAMGTITSTANITSALNVASSTISNTAVVTSGLAISGTLITTNTTTITVTLTGGTLYTTTNGVTLTMLSAGAPSLIALPETFSITGSGSDAREISVQGQCLRVQLEFSNAGQSYTPTLTIRALNRN
jgi:hypothetical protein